MTKDQFVKRIKLIQIYEEKQRLTRKGIGELINIGTITESVEDRIISETIRMMNESLEIQDSDLLYWWLWEDGKKQIYCGDEEIDVDTPEELYEFIVEGNTGFFL